MEKLLTHLRGKHLILSRNKNQEATGLLINVQTDYASLFTDDHEIIHFPYANIDPIVTNTKEIPQTTRLMDMPFPGTFFELLSGLVKKMVRVETRNGNHSGLLLEVTQEGISMVVEMEMVYISLDQVQSMVQVFKRTKGPEDQTQKQKSSNGDGDETADSRHKGRQNNQQEDDNAPDASNDANADDDPDGGKSDDDIESDKGMYDDDIELDEGMYEDDIEFDKGMYDDDVAFDKDMRDDEDERMWNNSDPFMILIEQSPNMVIVTHDKLRDIFHEAVEAELARAFLSRDAEGDEVNHRRQNSHGGSHGAHPTISYNSSKRTSSNDRQRNERRTSRRSRMKTKRGMGRKIVSLSNKRSFGRSSRLRTAGQ